MAKNDKTVEQVELLANSFNKLKRLHKSKKSDKPNCLSSEEIKLLRSQFKTIFVSILRLELAKKR